MALNLKSIAFETSATQILLLPDGESKVVLTMSSCIINCLFFFMHRGVKIVNFRITKRIKDSFKTKICKTVTHVSMDSVCEASILLIFKI